jgi:hypothetical protein
LPRIPRAVNLFGLLRQREVFPDAQIEILRDSGHFPYLDDPEAVAGAVIRFLRTQCILEPFVAEMLAAAYWVTDLTEAWSSVETPLATQGVTDVGPGACSWPIGAKYR